MKLKKIRAGAYSADIGGSRFTATRVEGCRSFVIFEGAKFRGYEYSLAAVRKNLKMKKAIEENANDY